jgi:SAM-dependent methyltransferase
LTEVYGTAKPGLRSRLGSRVAGRARARRHERFRALTGAGAGTRILDLGCGTLGLRALEPGLDITGVDIVDRPGYPGPFVRADATVRLPFADGEFDLVYSSSVVEHVRPQDRRPFAAEILRVGRAWWVQTPAYSFPVEPHALLPFAHWLPPRVRRPYWRLGVAGGWEDVALLRRGELAALFPGGDVVAERLGPVAKSWIAVGSRG